MTSYVSLLQLFSKITVVTSRRNTQESKSSVRVYPRYLDIREHIASPLSHQPLICTSRTGEFAVFHDVAPIAYRQFDQVTNRIGSAHDRRVLGVRQRFTCPHTTDMLLHD
ncbi:hypothetical protein AQ779_23600 [Burkholderia pseudomallei]|nr:hypothetical protein AQ853_29005 [Burkholderia pseudomallei]OMU42849.1 hypothetical protein AQ776_16110 [Burkholderia pseudomallei]OMU74679.1 hypothetical protein AQ779_23600 [Burkholderia pseudomallei]OMV08013.1 hypothetical protein AQ786_23600 [Burkholderia pseudomallei]OMV28066.1 hypothetical protein AQ789_20730 [Burkholderia pseudomallei]